MTCARSPDRLLDNAPDALSKLNALHILGDIIQPLKDRQGSEQDRHSRCADAGRNPKPGLLAELDHHAIFDLPELDRDRSLPAAASAPAGRNLDRNGVRISNCLHAEIAAVESRLEFSRHVLWRDVPMINSLLHLLDYNRNRFTESHINDTLTPSRGCICMSRLWIRTFTALVLVTVLGLTVARVTGGHMDASAQQPTGTIPTVTGTPTGPVVTVQYEEQINVRTGPGSRTYPIIGFMIPGQSAPALGRSPGGDWIEIYFPGVPGNVGWVYSPLVRLTPGFLPIIEPPPSPTPKTTATLDPTLVAAYTTPIIPTRMPTFTAPPPLEVPTFVDESSPSASGGVPAGLIIVGLAFIGGFGILALYLRR
jgi:hypothetical protein